MIVSDDMEMNAIAGHGTIEDAAVDAIGAGVDLLLVCKTLEVAQRVIERIEQAVARGELPLDRVRDALRRVSTLKRSYLVRPFTPRSVSSKGWRRHQALAREIERLGT